MKPYPYRTLPGGRRVIDYGALKAERTAAAAAGAPAPAEADPFAGTAADILEYVGQDAERAAAALEAEAKRDKPRSTLVAKLEAIE